MKQLDIFQTQSNDDVEKNNNRWQLFVDGASRNNPGPSGIGIYLLKNDIVEVKCGYYVGIKTNNQAEYLALLLGLFIVEELFSSGDNLLIISDSQLLVRQLMGIYKVKQAHLLPLYLLCKEKMHKLGATIQHVLRHENNEADAMANEGIDRKIVPVEKYRALLKHHDIVL